MKKAYKNWISELVHVQKLLQATPITNVAKMIDWGEIRVMLDWPFYMGEIKYNYWKYPSSTRDKSWK